MLGGVGMFQIVAEQQDRMSKISAVPSATQLRLELDAAERRLKQALKADADWLQARDAGDETTSDDRAQGWSDAWADILVKAIRATIQPR